MWLICRLDRFSRASQVCTSIGCSFLFNTGNWVNSRIYAKGVRVCDQPYLFTVAQPTTIGRSEPILHGRRIIVLFARDKFRRSKKDLERT